MNFALLSRVFEESMNHRMIENFADLMRAEEEEVEEDLFVEPVRKFLEDRYEHHTAKSVLYTEDQECILCSNPGLFYKKERISLPLSSTSLSLLVSLGKSSPFFVSVDKKSKNRPLIIPMKNFEFRNPTMNPKLELFFNKLNTKHFGLEMSLIEFKNAKLMLCQQGCAFKTSVPPNKKNANIFGFLFILLPSLYAGGEFQWNIGNEKKEFTTPSDMEYKCYFAAHLFDVPFESLPILSGSRLLLVYEMHWTNDKVPKPSLAALQKGDEEYAALWKTWKGDSLYFPIEEGYTELSLQHEKTKNINHIRHIQRSNELLKGSPHELQFHIVHTHRSHQEEMFRYFSDSSDDFEDSFHWTNLEGKHVNLNMDIQKHKIVCDRGAPRGMYVPDYLAVSRKSEFEKYVVSSNNILDAIHYLNSSRDGFLSLEEQNVLLLGRCENRMQDGGGTSSLAGAVLCRLVMHNNLLIKFLDQLVENDSFRRQSFVHIFDLFKAIFSYHLENPLLPSNSCEDSAAKEASELKVTEECYEILIKDFSRSRETLRPACNFSSIILVEKPEKLEAMMEGEPEKMLFVLPAYITFPNDIIILGLFETRRNRFPNGNDGDAFCFQPQRVLYHPLCKDICEYFKKVTVELDTVEYLSIILSEPSLKETIDVDKILYDVSNGPLSKKQNRAYSSRPPSGMIPLLVSLLNTKNWKSRSQPIFQICNGFFLHGAVSLHEEIEKKKNEKWTVQSYDNLLMVLKGIESSQHIMRSFNFFTKRECLDAMEIIAEAVAGKVSDFRVIECSLKNLVDSDFKNTAIRILVGKHLGALRERQGDNPGPVEWRQPKAAFEDKELNEFFHSTKKHHLKYGFLNKADARNWAFKFMMKKRECRDSCPFSANFVANGRGKGAFVSITKTMDWAPNVEKYNEIQALIDDLKIQYPFLFLAKRAARAPDEEPNVKKYKS